MGKKKTLIISLICVILAFGLIKTMMILNEHEMTIQTKTEELIQVENKNSVLENTILNKQIEASSLINEIESLETQVTNLESEKLEYESLVLNFQSETSNLNNELNNLEVHVSILEDDVTNLETEVVENYNLGYVEGETEGYQSGYDEGFVQGIDYINEKGWFSRDPTYNEAITFLNSDKTDQNEYSTPDYVCYDFTADFNKNAQEAGYRCGFVYIEFTDSAHAIVCFNTTDRGLIYIEPQTDEIIELTIGQLYLDSTIRDISLIW
ncbi:hypothetical protein KJN74_03435 [Candidatus Bathyarchaeota archaeon]|nr:hypothetical protein [Candidatus Bathyarchaeota archaeon]